MNIHDISSNKPVDATAGWGKTSCGIQAESIIISDGEAAGSASGGYFGITQYGFGIRAGSDGSGSIVISGDSYVYGDGGSGSSNSNKDGISTGIGFGSMTVNGGEVTGYSGIYAQARIGLGGKDNSSITVNGGKLVESSFVGNSFTQNGGEAEFSGAQANVDFRGGSCIVTGSPQALNNTPIIAEGCMAKASTDINGSSPTTYSASNLSSYKYIKFSGAQKYTVTVENGSVVSVNGTAAEDETVKIEANEPEAGMAFDRWTSEDGVTFADANSAQTTFVMPGKAVTVKAVFKENHTHHWSYVLADGKTDTIAAVCSDVDCSDNGGSAKITAPTGALVYGDANSKTAVVTNGFSEGVTAPSAIAYAYKSEEGGEYTPIDGTPQNAGWYKASISAGAVTAYVEYSIAKQTNIAAPSGLEGVAPTTNGGGDGKITGVDATMEWSASSGFTGAQDVTGSEILNLTAGDYYVRVKETANTAAGNAVKVTVPAGVDTLSGTVSITGTQKYGSVLTASVENSNNSGTLSYQWMRYGEPIEDAIRASYTLTQEDIGTTITCVVTSSAQNGSISGTTGIIEKADGSAAPSGLEGVAPTTNGGGDGKIIGVDATMEWSANQNFTGAQDVTGSEISSLTAGDYYVRVKETETSSAGEYVKITVPASVGTPPTITINELAAGTAGLPYSQQLTASGAGQISWSLEEDSSLPEGMTLTQDGLINGTPMQAGSLTFTVKAENEAGFATVSLTITIAPAAVTVNLKPGNTIVRGKADVLQLVIGEGVKDIGKANFFSLTADGQLLEPGSNTFTVSDGSILIEFSPEYLNMLSPGEHRFTSTLTGGAYEGAQVTATVTVIDEDLEDAIADLPQTGDDSNVLIWGALALASMSAVAVLRRKRRVNS